MYRAPLATGAGPLNSRSPRIRGFSRGAPPAGPRVSGVQPMPRGHFPARGRVLHSEPVATAVRAMRVVGITPARGYPLQPPYRQNVRQPRTMMRGALSAPRAAGVMRPRMRVAAPVAPVAPPLPEPAPSVPEPQPWEYYY
jgi:hypothetical protein